MAFTHVRQASMWKFRAPRMAPLNLLERPSTIIQCRHSHRKILYGEIGNLHRRESGELKARAVSSPPRRRGDDPSDRQEKTETAERGKAAWRAWALDART